MNFKTSKLKLLLFGLIIIIGMFMFIFQSSSAEKNSTSEGIWQIIVDGKPSEGAFFYRLNLLGDGKAILEMQGDGKSISEIKSWTSESNKLILSSDQEGEIEFFNNATLTLEGKNLKYSKGDFTGILNLHKPNLAFGHWLLILLVLVSLNEVMRRYKIAGYLFYFIIPIIAIPYWNSHGVSYWFKWVKLYSVVGASVWFILIRFKGFDKYKGARFVCAMFLALNIGEAVTQDLSMGLLPNLMNGIAGILSIVTLFYGWNEIRVDQSKYKDMIWDKMPILWIVAYDIWNWVFVYLNFPGSASAQFMVLLSCTLPALFIKKGTWLQARAFTLAAWFMYYFTAPRFTESMELMVPRNQTLMIIVAALSLTANVIYAIIYVRRLMNSKSKQLVNAID